MSSFVFSCVNRLRSSQDNLEVRPGGSRNRGSLKSICYGPVLFPQSGFRIRHTCRPGLHSNRRESSVACRKIGFPSVKDTTFVQSQLKSFCSKNNIGPLVDKDDDDEESYSEKKEDDNRNKKFPIRLRRTLRFLGTGLKKGSIRSVIKDLVVFLRRNIRKVTLSVTVSVALGLCYLFLKLTAVPPSKAIPYWEFTRSLQDGLVTKVLFEEGSRRIYYDTRPQVPDDSQSFITDPQSMAEKAEDANASVKNIVGAIVLSLPRRDQLNRQNFLKEKSKAQVATPEWLYVTRKVDHDEAFLLSLMREKGIPYGSSPQSVLMSMRNTLITILSLWIPLTPLMWLLYRQVSAANSPAKKRRPGNELVSFDDVEGVDAAKVELLEVVLCLQGAINYKRLGAKLPRGILLVGPPGTGKTLLARAVAGEAGVPFFSVSASEFVELFVGRGAARIRDLFNVARKCAPSIIFIDELDAVGGKRGKSFNDERDQTLNQLLTEMDGFESDMKVIVIAATNRPEALDSALCRPGRFSRKVVVGEPDEEGRRRILAVHFRGFPLDEDTDIICDLVASLTPGFVGADLADLVNEAALLAARRGAETLSREDVMEAIERAKFGINGRVVRPSTIGKELEKLFPWMSSLIGKNEVRDNGLQGPSGYQTLT